MEYNTWNGQSFSNYVREVKEKCEDFLVFCEQVKEKYFADKDIEEEMFKKQSDLIHSLEFDDLTYHGIARLGKEIRSLRRNRREYKNDYLLNESIKNFAKDEESVNLVKNLITKLSELSDRLQHDEEFIKEQKYIKRSTLVENIGTMKLNSSNEEDNRSEDVILLNKILSRYATNVEIVADEDLDSNILYIKMQLDKTFTVSTGKKFLNELSLNIERFYKPGLRSIICETITSDMCTRDEYGKKLLYGSISIIDDDKINELYKLNITIREGKKDTVKNSKKKKRGGKKKR